MPRFAPYEPVVERRPPAEVELARAAAPDVEALAGLVARREGLPFDEARRGLEREVARGTPDHALWVARLAGEAVAFARATERELPLDHAPGVAPGHPPAGWYLTGVIVAEAWRRRGIARALTRARLDDLVPRATEVFYMANERNRASIDLHAAFGFEEWTRAFHDPRVSFEGGRGILFRLDLERWAHERAGARQA